MLLPLFSEPTNPPRNVQATALSSTEIMVTWERVSAINESGIITNYEVEVEPVDFTDILIIIYVNTTNLSTVITGLQEYVEYDIRVRAYTVIGPGPFSPPETERTLEDGMCFHIICRQTVTIIKLTEIYCLLTEPVFSLCIHSSFNY